MDNLIITIFYEIDNSGWQLSALTSKFSFHIFLRNSFSFSLFFYCYLKMHALLQSLPISAFLVVFHIFSLL